MHCKDIELSPEKSYLKGIIPKIIQRDYNFYLSTAAISYGRVNVQTNIEQLWAFFYLKTGQILSAQI